MHMTSLPNSTLDVRTATLSKQVPEQAGTSDPAGSDSCTIAGYHEAWRVKLRSSAVMLGDGNYMAQPESLGLSLLRMHSMILAACQCYVNAQ
jgi:hypothetical protein